jgi:putative thioredoxin
MSSPFVFDVTARDFDAQVVARSREVPVLLDFWAEWCGPCRTLGPVLEKLAVEFGGSFLLGKVDTEKEQELAYAFQVQGIPLCVLLIDGRPADAFQGALAEPEVRRFLAAHGIAPAQAEPVAEADPDTPPARLRAGLAAAARGDRAQARERLGGIGEEELEHPAAVRILDGLEALDAAVDAGAGGAAAQGILAGRAQLAAGDFDGAIEAWLGSLAADKGFAGGLARRHILLAFELIGLEPDAAERVAAFRRRLATLLF